MKIEYLTELHTKPVPRDYPAKHLAKRTHKIQLVQDFIVRITGDGCDSVVICVPSGYVTDGSSVPRIFHRVVHPFVTEARWASCVHDYIYSDLYFKFSKEFADDLLKQMIIKDGGSWFMANAFHSAVQLNITGGGW